MEEKEWPADNPFVKVIYDAITNKFGPPDVDFRAGSRSFWVHKKVLEKHSSVLKAKLSDVWQTFGDVFQLDEEYVEPEVVEELLTWIYYINAGLSKYHKGSTENAYSLCVAAHYLMISDIVLSCCDTLRENITPENFFDIYTLSKALNFDDLRKACENSIVDKPNLFLLNPHFALVVVKWTVKELITFIKKWLKFYKWSKNVKVYDTILLSLPIWIDSRSDRFREAENLLQFLPPKELSSNALFWFMETELYSRLDKSLRKQYYVRLYLPTGSSSTDKLYCVRRTDSHVFMANLHYLDLSVNQEWSSLLAEPFIFTPKFTPEDPQPGFSVVLWSKSCPSGEYETTAPVLGIPWRENIYFFGHTQAHQSSSKHRHIKVFSTQTGEWISSEVTKPLNINEQEMLAGAVLNDYIYITGGPKAFVAGKSVSRYCLKTKQWETLEEMQTARLPHQLVGLDGLLYAIGGEAGSRPERYNPQTNRWEYIAPSNYCHKLPASVEHEEQIYVLSQAGFEVYSPQTNRWSELPVPGVCQRPSLVSIAGSLWLLTDSVHSPMASRLVYEFDIVDRKWNRLPDLPDGHYTDFSIVIKQ